MDGLKTLLSPYGTLIVSGLLVVNGFVDATIVDLNWVPPNEGWQWVLEGAGLGFLRRAVGFK